MVSVVVFKSFLKLDNNFMCTHKVATFLTSGNGKIVVVPMQIWIRGFFGSTL